jgi:hypothetical protein
MFTDIERAVCRWILNKLSIPHKYEKKHTMTMNTTDV